MRNQLEEQEKMLDKFKDDIMELFDQFAARLEKDARQPRLAMEVDGPANTKTREGAATAVQAMRGDGVSACRVEPGPNANSTSFGVMAEPPTLPRRDDIVVESGDAALKACLLSLEIRSSTAAGGIVPTGKASTLTDTSSTATETNFNQSPYRFYKTEETDSEANSKDTNLRTSTPYASESNLPTAPYCWRVNPDNIGFLIQAIRKVTSAPAHFWDCGARWFVVRLYMLEKLGDELQRFSE